MANVGANPKAYTGRKASRHIVDLATEQTRLLRAKADEAERQRAVLARELLPVSDVVAGWTAALGVLRQRLLAMPSKLAAELAASTSEGEAKAIVEVEVTAALAELTETDFGFMAGIENIGK